MRLLQLAILLFCVVALPKVGRAENVTFTIQSSYQYKAQVSFYSQNRRHEWPGSGRAYDLNDSDDHTFRLNCNRGEKICYGAWATGNGKIYWGVGADDEHGCQGCCLVCERGAQLSRNLTYEGGGAGEAVSGVLGALGAIAGAVPGTRRSAPVTLPPTRLPPQGANNRPTFQYPPGREPGQSGISGLPPRR